MKVAGEGKQDELSEDGSPSFCGAQHTFLKDNKTALEHVFPTHTHCGFRAQGWFRGLFMGTFYSSGSELCFQLQLSLKATTPL